MVDQTILYTLGVHKKGLRQKNKFFAEIEGRPSTQNIHIGKLTTFSVDKLENSHIVNLPVSPDQQFVVKGKKVIKRDKGYLSWIGSLQNTAGTATLVIGSDGITGTVRTDSTLYSFEPIGNGLQAIIQLDKNKLKSNHPLKDNGAIIDNRDPQKIDSLKKMIEWSISKNESQSVSVNSPNSGPDIDVLVVYTAAAANDVFNIDGKVQNTIDQTNTAFSNSNVYANLNLVHSAQVNYNESQHDYEGHVNAMQDRSDGIMDNINSLRNQHLADIVVLLVKDRDQDTIGKAYDILATTTTAFAAVDVFWSTANYAFAHEVGHLFGPRHNKSRDNTNDPYEYQHGYIGPDDSFHTIMAFGKDCNNCLGIQYFSNPDVTYGGDPIGTEAHEDNAQVINRTKYTLRDFRTLRPPYNFTITNRYSYGESPHFTWTDNPDANSHYLYRCTTTSGSYSPWCFQRIGGGSSEATDYHVTLADPNGGYPSGCQKSAIYYITAQNRTGESAYNRTISVCIESN